MINLYYSRADYTKMLQTYGLNIYDNSFIYGNLDMLVNLYGDILDNAVKILNRQQKLVLFVEDILPTSCDLEEMGLDLDKEIDIVKLKSANNIMITRFIDYQYLSECPNAKITVKTLSSDSSIKPVIYTITDLRPKINAKYMQNDVAIMHTEIISNNYLEFLKKDVTFAELYYNKYCLEDGTYLIVVDNALIETLAKNYEYDTIGFSNTKPAESKKYIRLKFGLEYFRSNVEYVENILERKYVFRVHKLATADRIKRGIETLLSNYLDFELNKVSFDIK